MTKKKTLDEKLANYFDVTCRVCGTSFSALNEPFYMLRHLDEYHHGRYRQVVRGEGTLCIGDDLVT